MNFVKEYVIYSAYIGHTQVNPIRAFKQSKK